LFTSAISRFGRLDVVVANAGVELIDTTIAGSSDEDFDRLFNVNAKGAFLTLREAAHHVTDGGRIIYVGSSSTGYPLLGHGL
jgi:3-oxoacyl-[acyl-carrier protein] reductase